MWVRGLKYLAFFPMISRLTVAPRVGAWIEIFPFQNQYHCYQVAPRVGAWIEIKEDDYKVGIGDVAPRVGAWIEMTWKHW